MMKTKNALSLSTLCLGMFFGNGAPLLRSQEFPSHNLPAETNPALLYWREFLILPTQDGEQIEAELKKTGVDAATRRVAAAYDEAFRRLKKIDRLEGPCDWGDDLSEGPELLLPHLAKARQIARAAVIRTRVHLADGNDESAADELISIHRLGEHLTASPILINLLVDFAMDKLCAEVIARHLGQFSESSLRKLRTGFAESPTAKTVADAVDTERTMLDWIGRRLERIQADHPDDPAKAMAEAEAMMGILFAAGADETASAMKAFRDASGASIDGLLRLVRNSAGVYDEVKRMAQLAPGGSSDRLEAFEKSIGNNANPVVRMMFPAIGRSRTKEVGNLVLNASLIAAIEYRLNGAEGVRAVADPCGDGPLGVRPYTVDGARAGFFVESVFEDATSNRVLFLLKPVKSVVIFGEDAGSVRDSETE